MSKIKNVTCDKIKLQNLSTIPYLCDDMSVKQSEKTYSNVKDVLKITLVSEIYNLKWGEIYFFM